MLKSIYIGNYALIDEIDISFTDGFSTVTGETGAGKSIILGALSLVLGKRADLSVLREKGKKCVIEISFDIKGYPLEHFFIDNDLDFEEVTIMRREIGSNGKSRAFINDTPVALQLMKELGESLIDIHSQYENLKLNLTGFQLGVVDSFALNANKLEKYRNAYNNYRTIENEFTELKESIDKIKSDKDYLQYQFDQLEEANLTDGEQESSEEELDLLNHAEEIKATLVGASDVFLESDQNIIDQIKNVETSLEKLVRIYPRSQELYERTKSILIEVKDLAQEFDLSQNDVVYEPDRLEFVQERLNVIYSLQQKFMVGDVRSLVELKNELGEKLGDINTSDSKLEKLEQELKDKKGLVTDLALELSSLRKKHKEKIEKKILLRLGDLGMPNSSFKIEFEKLPELGSKGLDKVVFTFSANKNTELNELGKVASGGELSRVMLTIKSLTSHSSLLPTVIFDEIDTGVSGDIADKMGDMMSEMAKKMQVLSITHLPQIAGKGKNQFLVYKRDSDSATNTYIKQLNDKERIEEIARMLSGKSVTDAAIKNAKELLSF